MKTLLLLLLTAVAANLAVAQGTDVTSVGGSVSVFAATLDVPLSPVVYPATGVLTMRTGNLLTGDFQNGATFDGTGTITITVGGATVFSGNIDAGAAWVKNTTANGHHFYLLTGTINGNGTSGGAFTLATVTPTTADLFSGSTTILSVHVHLN